MEASRDIRPDRNVRIQSLLLEGHVPILPFERAAMNQRLQGLKDRQNELGSELNKSMHQTSETWHDNAVGDAINFEAKAVAIQGKQLNESLLDSYDIDYPEDDYEVTVGSIVELEFGSGSQVVLITGRSMEITDPLVLAQLPERFMSATVQSPMGQALLGAQAGEQRAYEANGRTIEVRVLSIGGLKAAQ